MKKNILNKIILGISVIITFDVNVEAREYDKTDIDKKNITRKSEAANPKKYKEDEKKFLSIIQDITSNSDENLRAWEKSLERIRTHEILNPEVLTTLGIYDNQKEIIKVFIQKTNASRKYIDKMMVALQERLPEVDNRSTVIKKEIEDIKIEASMINGILKEHLKLADIMIELLDMMKSDHGKWKYQKYKHKIVFSNEKLNKEYDRLSKAFVNQYKKIEKMNRVSKGLDISEKAKGAKDLDENLWQKGRSLEFVAALCYDIAKSESDKYPIDELPYPKYTFKEVKQSYELLQFNLLKNIKRYRELFSGSHLYDDWLLKVEDVNVSTIKDSVKAKSLAEGVIKSIKIEVQKQMQTESYIYLNHCTDYLMKKYTPQQLWNKSTKTKDIYSVIKKEIEKDM